jgi:hypothetical protein
LTETLQSTQSSIQPDHASKEKYITDYRMKQCTNDAILRLEILLLTTPESLIGSKLAEDVLSILQLYTSNSSPIQALEWDVSIPKGSKLLALCQKLNGVEGYEMVDHLAELILGAWTAHQRLLAKVKEIKANPVQEWLLL